MTNKRDDDLMERLAEAEKAALEKREAASSLTDSPYSRREKAKMIDVVAESTSDLRKDMVTARNNAQLLIQRANRLKEQADYWTGIHERLTSVVNLYANMKKGAGDIEAIK